MEQVERVAETSVARGCGFAALGIACVLLGFAHEPAAMLRAAALLVTGLAVLLLLLARRARARPYRETETWLMLDPAQRPPAAIAQRTVGVALEEAHLRFAGLAGRIAITLWGLLLVVHALAWLGG